MTSHNGIPFLVFGITRKVREGVGIVVRFNELHKAVLYAPTYGYKLGSNLYCYIAHSRGLLIYVMAELEEFRQLA